MLELQFLSTSVALCFLGKKGGTCWGRIKAGVKKQRSRLKLGAAEGAGPLGVLGKVGAKSARVGGMAQSALRRTREKRCLAALEGLSAMQLYKLVAEVCDYRTTAPPRPKEWLFPQLLKFS